MSTDLILFDDILTDKRGFEKALLLVGQSFRHQIGLPDIVHEVGVVCPDVQKAAEHLEATYGMGPFFLARGAPKEFIQGGQKRQFSTAVGFGYYGDVLIELAEPGHNSNVFETHLDKAGGRIVLHHVGFFAKGPELRIRGDVGKPGGPAFASAFDKLGMKPQWEALVGILGVTGDVTIYETYEQTGGIAIEFLDIRWARGPKGRGGLPVNIQGTITAMGKMQVGLEDRIFDLPEKIPGKAKKKWTWVWRRDFPIPPAKLWPWVTQPAKMSQWAKAEIWQAAESRNAGLKPDDPRSIREVWLRPAKKLGRARKSTRPNKKPYIREQIDTSNKPHSVNYHIIEGGGVDSQVAAMRLKPNESGGTSFEWEVTFVPKSVGSGPLIYAMVDRGTVRSLDALEGILDPDGPKSRKEVTRENRAERKEQRAEARAVRKKKKVAKKQAKKQAKKAKKVAKKVAKKQARQAKKVAKKQARQAKKVAKKKTTKKKVAKKKTAKKKR